MGQTGLLTTPCELSHTTSSVFPVQLAAAKHCEIWVM